MFEGIRTKLQGIKTYLAAASAILLAVVGFADGGTDLFQTLQLIAESVMVVTLRAGIASSK